ncbi:pentatricopeptide repeat-containing protein 2, mitochondrial-like [Prorops nasuta]|uniref:pentatricopeptide repeat-containing protein 2, mitochondrial-like n=1 Tax=Prorops nasuta TaxID=863751 RepID=UPI0034CE7652
MAGSLRLLFRLNSGIINGAIKSNIINGTRSIFSENALGLTSYETTRYHINNQFQNVADTFREKMKEVCQADDSMIFTEDLKAMLHLAKKDPQDLDLVYNMLKKFNSQNRELRFGTFVFGPVAMRTFYHLDEPDYALKAYKDPAFEGLFDQATSRQVFLELLVKHSKYEEVRQIYEKMLNELQNINLFPKNEFIVYSYGMYKENAPESFESIVNSWKKINSIGTTVVPRRALIYMAMLALNQNKPDIALEIISAIKMTRYVDVKNIKVLVYLKLKRYTEITILFKECLFNENPQTRREVFCLDVMKKVEDAIMEQQLPEDNDLVVTFNRVKTQGFVMATTFSERLELPIDPVRPQRLQETGFIRRRPGREMFQNPGPLNRRSNFRPTLKDLL